MARIDSILSIVLQQGANELRVVADREPKMLAYGTLKKWSMPPMSEDILRDLLGEIMTSEVETRLAAGERIELEYETSALGTFHVTLAKERAGAFEARFLRGRATSPAPPSPAPVVDVSVASAEVAAPPSRTAFTAARPRFAVQRYLSDLVARAVATRASDLHLGDGETPVIRVDGKLRALDDGAPADVAEAFGMEPADLAAVRAGHSIDVSLELPGSGRIRVHLYATDQGLAAALRLLPPRAPSFASLHMPVAFDDLALLSHGLVLVCGATGAGKSTTLAALAQVALQRRSIVLVTLEDPIEYELAGSKGSIVRRRQIKRDAVDFASGLRDALREDPDVLLVGEMRDPETIALALTAAETGHLVLASLHSRSAASAVDRIVDASAPERQQQIRIQLAESLRGVVSQRLLPRARGTGRVAAVEVLRMNHAVASMIREGKTAQISHAIQAGRAEGMLSLERSLADRVRAGEIRMEDARAVANDPASLTTLLESTSR
ncbi:MAG: PilT/PilU family type 4a pilus ATPase [Polyangiaceae bacterium]|nr:PilT/PilU family type 4a pilus ATPase [Polyangiaceae bacterium]